MSLERLRIVRRCVRKIFAGFPGSPHQFLSAEANLVVQSFFWSPTFQECVSTAPALFPLSRPVPKPELAQGSSCPVLGHRVPTRLAFPVVTIVWRGIQFFASSGSQANDAFLGPFKDPASQSASPASDPARVGGTSSSCLMLLFTAVLTQIHNGSTTDVVSLHSSINPGDPPKMSIPSKTGLQWVRMMIFDLLFGTIRTNAMRISHKPLLEGCASRFAKLCVDRRVAQSAQLFI